MEQQPDCDFKVGGYEDAAHLKSCSLGVQKCARCKWATYKVKWQKDLPWLDAKMNLDSGLWGIGCRLCHDAQQVAPEVMSKFPVSRHHFARYEVSTGEIRVTRFRKHAESPAHRTAESMAGGKEPALDDVGGFTPSTAEWKSVINHTKPSNLQADVSDVANRKKAHMMRWCLAEAHREHQREAVKNALCLSLSQDQRGRRFLVRFRAVDANLQVCDGTLQLVKVVTSPDVPGAQGIRQMTLKALKNFCTPSSPPRTVACWMELRFRRSATTTCSNPRWPKLNAWLLMLQVMSSLPCVTWLASVAPRLWSSRTSWGRPSRTSRRVGRKNKKHD